jgi:mRNA interferase MazF
MDLVKRFDVVLVSLDPTMGSEIKKSRPCVVVSPDEMNQSLQAIIVAPMTSTQWNYPTRVGVLFDGKSGDIALDQIRTIDKKRILKTLGSIDSQTSVDVSKILVEMFTI